MISTMLDNTKMKDKETKIENLLKYSSLLSNLLQLAARKKENIRPALLKGGELKQHQIEGLRWMKTIFSANANGILADQMGLGKTIQAISWITYEIEKDPSSKYLVVCPLVTCMNWNNEFKKWAPTLKTIAISGRIEDSVVFAPNGDFTRRRFDVIITSFEGFLINFRQISRVNFNTFIIDEGHKLKNNDSQISVVSQKLNSKHRLLMTGTPLMNNLKELWSLLNFIMPELFKDRELFEDFLEAKEKISSLTNEQLLEKLHAITAPFILRRLKTDTAIDLPPKKEILIKIRMRTELEKTIYRQLILGVGKFSNPLNKQMELIKVCQHPYCIKGAEPKGLPEYGQHLLDNSSKLRMLDLLLDRLKQEGRKVLVYSNFCIMLNIIEDYCNYREHKYARIDGSCAMADRQESIDEFQSKNSSTFVFLISTKSGGVGITLTAADTVILYDSDWNPQSDLQAIDRVHRIGQTKPINIYRLIMEKTIEEKILEYQKVKLKLGYICIEEGRSGNISSSLMKAKPNKKKIDEFLSYGALEIFNEHSQDDEVIDIEQILTRGEIEASRLEEFINNRVKDLEENKFDLQYENVNMFNMELSEYEEECKRILKEQQKKFIPEKRQALYKPKKSKNSTQLTEEEIRERITVGCNVGELSVSNLCDDRLRYQELARKEARLNKLKSLGFKPLNEDLLSDEELQEYNTLKNNTFFDWDRKMLSQFLNRSAENGPSNFKAIAEALGNKSEEEVEAYANKFWLTIHTQRYPEGHFRRVINGYKTQLESKITKEALSLLITKDTPITSIVLPSTVPKLKIIRYDLSEYTIQHFQSFLLIVFMKKGNSYLDYLEEEAEKIGRFQDALQTLNNAYIAKLLNRILANWPGIKERVKRIYNRIQKLELKPRTAVEFGDLLNEIAREKSRENYSESQRLRILDELTFKDQYEQETAISSQSENGASKPLKRMRNNDSELLACI